MANRTVTDFFFFFSPDEFPNLLNQALRSSILFKAQQRHRLNSMPSSWMSKTPPATASKNFHDCSTNRISICEQPCDEDKAMSSYPNMNTLFYTSSHMGVMPILAGSMLSLACAHASLSGVTQHDLGTRKGDGCADKEDEREEECWNRFSICIFITCLKCRYLLLLCLRFLSPAPRR